MRAIICLFVAGCSAMPVEDMLAFDEPSVQPAFSIDRLLVTKGAYLACVEDGACNALSYHGGEASEPALVDSWNEAAAYCRWRDARLPTQLEFESELLVRAPSDNEWTAELEPGHFDRRGRRPYRREPVFYKPAASAAYFRCARSKRGTPSLRGMAFVRAGLKTLSSCRSERMECQPRTEVVQAFLLDRFEVTNIDYAACVEDGVCEASPYVFPREEPEIAALVQWNGAVTYCKWRGARLPNAIEWESAARSGDDRRFPWGNEPLERCADVTLTCGNRISIGSGARDVTNDGVRDMSGGADEWVTDTGMYRYQLRGSEVSMFTVPDDHTWHGFRCARDIY